LNAEGVLGEYLKPGECLSVADAREALAETLATRWPGLSRFPNAGETVSLDRAHGVVAVCDRRQQQFETRSIPAVANGGRGGNSSRPSGQDACSLVNSSLVVHARGSTGRLPAEGE
jgi:hypothetical protein